METEFWGVEVKAGQLIKCNPATDGKLLHLSQASLGGVTKDKGSDSVPLSVKIDTDSEGTHAFLAKESGKNEVKDEKPKLASTKANSTKPEASDAKPKLKIVEPEKLNDKYDDSDDDESSEEEDTDEDEDMVEFGDDIDEDDEEEDSEDESSEEDEATPKKDYGFSLVKTEAGKKRPVESATKTPVLEKKAKLVAESGQKSATDGKKGGHTATPYPLKQAGRKLANDNMSKPNAPESGGRVTCKSSSKTSNSENALQSQHAKAKHSTGK